MHMMVHGDDFVIIAKQAGRQKTLQLLSDNFELKHSTAGLVDGMPKELRVLGRIAVVHDWGWTLEADPCLIESAVVKMGMEDAKGAVTPGHKLEVAGSGAEVKARRQDPRPVYDLDAAWPGFDTSPKLEGEALKRYQSVSALLNFTAQDRPELLYAIKELMRKMSCPTKADESGVKRAIRFLKTAPRLVAKYPWQKLAGHIEVYADSDHAGCPLTRRSTSGGCILWGANL